MKLTQFVIPPTSAPSSLEQPRWLLGCGCASCDRRSAKPVVTRHTGRPIVPPGLVHRCVRISVLAIRSMGRSDHRWLFACATRSSPTVCPLRSSKRVLAVAIGKGLCQVSNLVHLESDAWTSKCSDFDRCCSWSYSCRSSHRVNLVSGASEISTLNIWSSSPLTMVDWIMGVLKDSVVRHIYIINQTSDFVRCSWVDNAIWNPSTHQIKALTSCENDRESIEKDTNLPGMFN